MSGMVHVPEEHTDAPRMEAVEFAEEGSNDGPNTIPVQQAYKTIPVQQRRQAPKPANQEISALPPQPVPGSSGGNDSTSESKAASVCYVTRYPSCASVTSSQCSERKEAGPFAHKVDLRSAEARPRRALTCAAPLSSRRSFATFIHSSHKFLILSIVSRETIHLLSKKTRYKRRKRRVELASC